MRGQREKNSGNRPNRENRCQNRMCGEKKTAEIAQIERIAVKIACAGRKRQRKRKKRRGLLSKSSEQEEKDSGNGRKGEDRCQDCVDSEKKTAEIAQIEKIAVRIARTQRKSRHIRHPEGCGHGIYPWVLQKKKIVIICIRARALDENRRPLFF